VRRAVREVREWSGSTKNRNSIQSGALAKVLNRVTTRGLSRDGDAEGSGGQRGLINTSRDGKTM